MEPRVTELETHLKYIRRDMDEVRSDVRTIKHRLAYSAGATAVVMGLLGWVANSRFDQLVTLLSHCRNETLQAPAGSAHACICETGFSPGAHLAG